MSSEDQEPDKAPDETDDARFRVVHVGLDEDAIAKRGPDIEHERKVAIFDLLEENFFKPIGSPGGPYELELSIVENRLVFDVRLEGGEPHGQVILSLTPFRKIIKDYFLICESYYEAIKSASLQQIEAIDMGRRGLHNEGSELLRERLAGKIELDLDTARRLFTLICALHIKGL